MHFTFRTLHQSKPRKRLSKSSSTSTSMSTSTCDAPRTSTVHPPAWLT